MVKIEDNLTITNHKSIRYCRNCKGEYKFDKFIQNYSKSQQDLVANLWQNPKIRFYCP